MQFYRLCQRRRRTASRNDKRPAFIFKTWYEFVYIFSLLKAKWSFIQFHRARNCAKRRTQRRYVDGACLSRSKMQRLCSKPDYCRYSRLWRRHMNGWNIDQKLWLCVCGSLPSLSKYASVIIKWSAELKVWIQQTLSARSKPFNLIRISISLPIQYQQTVPCSHVAWATVELSMPTTFSLTPSDTHTHAPPQLFNF